MAELFRCSKLCLILAYLFQVVDTKAALGGEGQGPVARGKWSSTTAG
jgi:hypothetical protein